MYHWYGLHQYAAKHHLPIWVIKTQDDLLKLKSQISRLGYRKLIRYKKGLVQVTLLNGQQVLIDTLSLKRAFNGFPPQPSTSHKPIPKDFMV